MIFNKRILPATIIRQLRLGLGMKEEDINLLFDPADKQNVPKAVKLMQKLGALRSKGVGSDPGDQNDHKYVSFMADILICFVEPFTNIEMKLLEQFISLVSYSHLIAALYARHRTHFMTGALYSDSQAIVKNITFLIARTQLLNPTAKLYLILEGTNCLEMLFGDCRTMDHARNFDIEQLLEKMSTSMVLNSIFEKNPHLNRGHQRLNLTDAIGVDHINPKSWRGNVEVGQVDLPEMWKKGRADALKVLEHHFGISNSGVDINFNSAWVYPPATKLGGTFCSDDYT